MGFVSKICNKLSYPHLRGIYLPPPLPSSPFSLSPPLYLLLKSDIWIEIELLISHIYAGNVVTIANIECMTTIAYRDMDNSAFVLLYSPYMEIVKICRIANEGKMRAERRRTTFSNIKKNRNARFLRVSDSPPESLE